MDHSEKSNITFDWLIVGGGLAGKLTAWLLHEQTNGQIALIEQEEQLPQHHTWSCFESDLPATLRDDLEQLPWIRWASHQVHFPHFSRELQLGYRSLRERDLNQLVAGLPRVTIWLGYQVSKAVGDLGDYEVRLGAIGPQEKDCVLKARQMIWATGWSGSAEQASGYQKFVGLEIKFSQPHGLKLPVIMDARVPQEDGYRFFYLLPFSEQTLLVEDTYYSTSKDLDVERLKNGILAYVSQNLGSYGQVIYQEQGVLPIPLEPLASRTKHGEQVGWGLGAAAGMFHLVTGYSLPVLLPFLADWAKNGFLVVKSDRKIKSSQWPYLLLNQFLFLGASGHERWKMFDFFYRRLDEELVGRFYGGRMGFLDWLRFYASWPPPIPVVSALKVMVHFVLCWLRQRW